MKLRPSHLLWIVLVLAAGAWIWSRLGSADQRVIRQKLSRLESLIEKDGSENNLVDANKVRQIGDLLTPEFEVDVVPYSQKVTNRQELMRLAMGYRARSQKVGVDFRDEELTIDAASRSARLAAVVVVSGGEMRRESYRVAMDLEKSGSDWLIRRVEVLEVLEGSPLF